MHLGPSVTSLITQAVVKTIDQVTGVKYLMTGNSGKKRLQNTVNGSWGKSKNWKCLVGGDSGKAMLERAGDKNCAL